MVIPPAQFKLKFHYRPGNVNGHTDALFCFPGEHPGEDVDPNEEDIDVAPVLPRPATLHTIEEPDKDPPTETDKLYSCEEWALSQQKDPDLIQVPPISLGDTNPFPRRPEVLPTIFGYSKTVGLTGITGQRVGKYPLQAAGYSLNHGPPVVYPMDLPNTSQNWWPFQGGPD